MTGEHRQSEYGPRGYLPERAAQRARKIVLREPMGLQWPVAAGVAAILVLVVGALFLATRTGPPGPPFVHAGPIQAIDPRGAALVRLDGTEVLVLRGAGGVLAFAAPEAEVVWCGESGRLEAADGRVWRPDGRLVGGAGESLQPLRAQAHAGELYIDPVTELAVPAPDPSAERPACF